MMENITIAIPKGRNLKPTVKLFQTIGIDASIFLTDTRKLLASQENMNVNFMVVRDTDIPTYVEYGAADIGISGKDVLLEKETNVYEPIDLKFGYCRMVLAEPEDLRLHDDPSTWTHVRVATKYPNITEKYFKNKGIEVDIIKLYGSIEIAPLVGLSERIVDLVSTGDTMKANRLVEVDEIAKISARLVVNRASLKTKHERINGIIEGLRANLDKVLKELE
ncbi:MAG: ATP phosphoribosyltransferase [Nitrospinota bacterium]